jgi:hypothetical protein
LSWSDKQANSLPNAIQQYTALEQLDQNNYARCQECLAAGGKGKFSHTQIIFSGEGPAVLMIQIKDREAVDERIVKDIGGANDKFKLPFPHSTEYRVMSVLGHGNGHCTAGVLHDNQLYIANDGQVTEISDWKHFEQSMCGLMLVKVTSNAETTTPKESKQPPLHDANFTKCKSTFMYFITHLIADHLSFSYLSNTYTCSRRRT